MQKIKQFKVINIQKKKYQMEQKQSNKMRNVNKLASK